MPSNEFEGIRLKWYIPLVESDMICMTTLKITTMDGMKTVIDCIFRLVLDVVSSHDMMSIKRVNNLG